MQPVTTPLNIMILLGGGVETYLIKTVKQTTFGIEVQADGGGLLLSNIEPIVFSMPLRRPTMITWVKIRSKLFTYDGEVGPIAAWPGDSVILYEGDLNFTLD